MADETYVRVEPGFWRAFFTVPNIVAFAIFLIGVGGWWQEQKQTRERLERLETRVIAERAMSDLIYMRRDVLTEQLRQIQEEQTRMREQVQLLRRDLR